MSETAIITPDKPIVGLKREIGLLSASNFLINVIIGKLITTVVICYVKLSDIFPSGAVKVYNTIVRELTRYLVISKMET